jgi:hypothetical protein
MMSWIGKSAPPTPTDEGSADGEQGTGSLWNQARSFAMKWGK